LLDPFSHLVKQREEERELCFWPGARRSAAVLPWNPVLVGLIE
jgi:hypothetical protein